MSATKTSEPLNAILPEWLEIVRRKVEGLHYGIVQIIVHENHVTQIEKTEKTRLDSPKPEPVLRRGENY
jgi:hypothetical protein